MLDVVVAVVVEDIGEFATLLLDEEDEDVVCCAETNDDESVSAVFDVSSMKS